MAVAAIPSTADLTFDSGPQKTQGISNILLAQNISEESLSSGLFIANSYAYVAGSQGVVGRANQVEFVNSGLEDRGRVSCWIGADFVLKSCVLNGLPIEFYSWGLGRAIERPQSSVRLS
jgi:hypothetical protein